MENIKKKILISDLNESNIHFKIQLTQSIDDLGMMTDMPFNNTFIVTSNGDYEFMNDYITEPYSEPNKIISASDSKLETVRSYNTNKPFIEGFDIRSSDYLDFQSNPITGFDKVITTGDTMVYTVNAKKDLNIGTSGQTTGILYTDNPEGGVIIPPELDNQITTTKVEYIGEGWNETNTSIDPQIQEEYLIGIINEPEVETDVFIDRTTFSVLDNHLRLSEIESLDHLTRYGNGFYNINRD